MEKTISNIKKILHIGPKKVKDDNFKNDENDAPKMQEKVMTTKIELNREEIARDSAHNNRWVAWQYQNTFTQLLVVFSPTHRLWYYGMAAHVFL